MPALAAFDIEVDADSYFPELLLAVATVNVACHCCTLAIGRGDGVWLWRAKAERVKQLPEN